MRSLNLDYLPGTCKTVNVERQIGKVSQANDLLREADEARQIAVERKRKEVDKLFDEVLDASGLRHHVIALTERRKNRSFKFVVEAITSSFGSLELVGRKLKKDGTLSLRTYELRLEVFLKGATFFLTSVTDEGPYAGKI